MEKGSESRGQARWSIPFLFLLSLFCLALSEQIHYAVPEELAKGSLVGNLAKDLGVSLEDLPTRNLRVSAEKKFFAVSTENGDLLVSDRIDREQICGKKSTCVLEFEVMAEKPLNFFHVTVLIQDINDNPPTFNQNITELEISELALTGTTFALEPAQDLDVGVNSLQQYHLSPHPRFSLIQKENPDGSRYPELVLKAPLDREEQSTHHLVLTALDGGEPSRSCTTQIRIIVADANDNPPVFTQDTYRVSVSENLPPGSSVLTLIATDPDEGVNAEVTYAFITTEKSVTQLFKLDSYTGELTTGEGLDFEERASYTIGVEAKDSGHHTAYCKIQIDVLDENDNAPEITLASESQHIQEDALPGTVVALIKIYDLDSGVNGEILCQLKGKFPFKIIQDTKNTYRLVTDGALDREQFPDYNLTVTASDRGSPPLSSSRTITLHIADVNDNAPVFQQASYLVHVPENNPPGASLAQVSAFDPDRRPQLSELLLLFTILRTPWGASAGQIRYSIPEELDKGSFVGSISQDLGLEPRELAQRDRLPRDQRGYIHIQNPVRRSQRLTRITRTMAAQQRGGDYRGFVLLSILLGTRWEAWAERMLYSVLEETDKGSFVGNIAQDLGLEPPELAQRGVRIVSRGRTQLFALNPRSGSLITAGRIDREELCAQSARCLVSFNILMEDKMNLYPIEVEIMDVNDNAPRFLTEEINVKIMENTAPGVRFPLSEAGDPDVGSNSLQKYQLSPNLHFSLAVQSGDDGIKYPELVLERVLDREEEMVHHLVLTAYDGGSPPRSGTAHIQVIVVDVNDHAPVFSQPQYQATIPENVPVGTRLLTVNAVDLDEGINGEVTYSFRKIAPKLLQIFHLNSITGELSTLEGLDYEESSFYEMEVQAQDGPGSLTKAKVLITVLDVNDNAPEVTITSVSSSIPEDTPPGTVIALFYLQDRDSGKNGEVTCTIPENLPFKLERSIDNYYRLVTAKNLDREKLSLYNITLKATDGGSPPLSTEIHISMHVADTNDNPPAFTHSSYSIYVPENNPRGASIFSVTAQDPDSDENAQVTYSLEEDTIQGAPVSSYVSINSDTGVLYALRSFDYEQFRHIQLRVTACDSGDPHLSSNVSLSLFVLDQNDNAPEILYPALPTDGSTGVELAPRSAEPGYLVTKVVAVDKDSPYRLLKASEPGLFVVGLHTGEVRTARALLDRDALKQSLVVAVQDHGQPPLSATITLTVAVADSIPDVLADLGSIKTPAEQDDSDLTLYLVVAVAVVSCVFLAFVVVLLALRLRRWHKSRFLQAAGMPASHFVGMDGVRAFLQTYSHEVSLTADSRKSHLIFPQPNYADTLISQESCEKKDSLLASIDFHECKDETPSIQVSPGIALYLFPQGILLCDRVLFCKTTA
ncbi:Protocadherin gamma-A7 [Tupaia chinensis]|uniref:Protocadherin gamma-A7 n=1 Tax=Tupaia chinensis TaxID=246437 RepID=L9JUQ9_TUPCH|nr:Protocadherin gamma-A7 [Tupaia chinensis]